jgi:hypothetical protein
MFTLKIYLKSGPCIELDKVESCEFAYEYGEKKLYDFKQNEHAFNQIELHTLDLTEVVCFVKSYN